MKKLKKILSILLVLTCVFALFACTGSEKPKGDNGGTGDNGDNTPPANLTPLQKVDNAVKNTVPATAKITTATTGTLGTLNGEFNITYNADKTAVITYSYEQWALIGSGSDADKDVLTGTITRGADGKYTDNKGFSANSPVDGIAAGFRINVMKLDGVATVKQDGTGLTAKVAKADSADVFGFAFDYDVDLEIVVSGDKVTKINMSFTDGKSNGMSGTISCVYN